MIKHNFPKLYISSRQHTTHCIAWRMHGSIIRIIHMSNQTHKHTSSPAYILPYKVAGIILQTRHTRCIPRRIAERKGSSWYSARARRKLTVRSAQPSIQGISRHKVACPGIVSRAANIDTASSRPIRGVEAGLLCIVGFTHYYTHVTHN